MQRIQVGMRKMGRGAGASDGSPSYLLQQQQLRLSVHSCSETTVAVGALHMALGWGGSAAAESARCGLPHRHCLS